MKFRSTKHADSRGLRRPKLLIGVAVVVVALALPAMVIARGLSDVFADVPTTHPFHNQIGAIARAGVTTGCSPGFYCPSDNVSREAMAAFMHRGFGRVHLADLPDVTPGASEAAPSGWTHAITPGLPAGALAGAAGFIKAEATITINLTNATGCPCRYRAALFLTGVGYMVERYTDVTLDTVGQHVNLSMTGAIGVTTSGAKTVEVRLFRATGSGAATAYGNSTSTYFPFGGTGTNVLGTGGAIQAPSGPNATG